MSDTSDATIADAIGRSIQEAVHADPEHPDDFVVGWLLVLELISPDGERSIMRLAPEELKSWQARGYLVEAADFGTWPWELEDGDSELE